MKRPPPTPFADELERRLETLSRMDEAGHQLPAADAAILAAITISSFAIVLLAQAL